MTRHTLCAVMLSGLIASLTTGCAGDDEYIFEHGPAGPNTERTLENLPEGLRPDNVKAHHTDETLQPED